MSESTTIQIKEKTLERLKYFKEYSKESYDEILNKVFDTLEEGDLTEMALRKIKKGLNDIKENKVIALEDYAKKKGINLG